ncbi:hypothetical protein BOO86_21540 [Mycobacterium sp. CBMA 234]|uniref:TetR/AcrR family transcriptional regulator n=1 Tax=Mycolicibacterium sp. CBMA 234 TaxID=1918495 RepID=UPI001390DAF7|nr:TetR/AcrR family transcriptional regulator [Mycolicibacterium sp. CBMA 234]MUL67071.1 hypothetical protein [Mycolicibacterium sp. CBMA 234]
MTTSSPRQRLDPDARRQQILSATARLLGDRPIEAVSTSEIAREAGVARGLLNHYYGTKRDLYLEVVRALTFVPDLGEIGTGSLRERAEAVITWMLDAATTRGRAWVAVAVHEGRQSDLEVRRILGEANDRAAHEILRGLGVEVSDQRHTYAIRALHCYGAMVKATALELIEGSSLTRPDAQCMLTETLLALVETF